MSNVVTVLWYEDTDKWLATAKSRVDKKAEALGLHLDYDHDFHALDEIVYNIGYDIALIDRMLSSTLIGSTFIHKLREHGSVTPIIYYTQAHDIDLQAEVEGLSDVKCVLREELVV
jgi:DNA-binding response OmpR family regulator